MFGINSSSITDVEDVLEENGLTTSTWYILCVYNLMVIVIGIFGNTALLYGSIVRGALKMDKVTLMLVYNLAISYIITTLVVFLPMFVTLIARRWVLGVLVCKLQAFFFYAPLFNEVFTILCVSVYRINLIIRGTVDMKKSARRAKYAMVFNVILSFVLCLVIILTESFAYYSPENVNCMTSNFDMYKEDSEVLKILSAALNLIFIVLPLILVCLINVGIVVLVRAQRAKVNRDVPKKTVLTLGVVTWAFLLSFSLLVLDTCVLHFIEWEPLGYEISMMYMLSVTILINPFIYVATSEEFRRFCVFWN